MKKQNKAMIAALLAGVLCAFSVLPAAANSAPSYWEGTDATGAVLTEGDCPLVVEHETLTFDIDCFPSTYYSDPESFFADTASVTAEYTFYNPTDMTVTAKLVFPYGQTPTYAASGYDHETGIYTEHVDLEKYGALVNGEPVQTVVRHTFSESRYDPDPVGSIGQIRDGYAKDAFFSQDLPVYVYTYRVKDLDDLTYRSARACVYLDPDASKTRILTDRSNGGRADGEGVRLTTSVGNRDLLTLYVMGEDIGELEWSFYENGGLETKIAGSMEMVSRSVTTFEEFAMQGYSEDMGVMRQDWYNAMIDCLEKNRWDEYGVYLNAYQMESLDDYLLEWYEYEITLAPGQRLVNTVKAPLYPHIDGDFDPRIYTYVYLLSPASRWVDFGKLDIYINTPYFIVEQTQGETEIAFDQWQKTDLGYELHLDGLPEGELIFTMCSAEQTERVVTPYTYLGIALIAAIVLVGLVLVVSVLLIGIALAVSLSIACVALALVVVLVVYAIRKHKKKDKA